MSFVNTEKETRKAVSDMGEIIFIALMVSAPLWLIAHELSELNLSLHTIDEDDEEGE